MIRLIKSDTILVEAEKSTMQMKTNAYNAFSGENNAFSGENKAVEWMEAEDLQALMRN